MAPTVLNQRAELFLPAEKYDMTSIASIPQTFTQEKVLSLRGETWELETASYLQITYTNVTYTF